VPDLLTGADLDYMRATQAEARPTPVWLQRYGTTRLPGGDVTRVPLGEPIPMLARIWDEPDQQPQALADRYEGGTLSKIALDMVLDVRAGDRITVDGTSRRWDIVSEGEPDAWSTAQPVWARRVDRPERTA
jgi:hypothetical protein